MYNAKESANKQRTILIVAIIVLVGIIGFLLINNSQKSKRMDEQASQLDETEKLKLDLEKQYYEALSELEAQRGTNEELNALIESQKEELKQQKNQISQLLATRTDLNKARAQIAELRGITDGYLAEIQVLKERNQLLEEENIELQEKTVQLTDEVQRERFEKEELASTKAAIASEKEKLEQSNVKLSAKVNKASVVKVSGLTVTGLEVRSSGKERSRKKASNVDRLRICFSANENAITEPGYERFYIRILDPNGVTLAVEADGSGTFTSNEDNKPIKYTLIKELDYDRNKADACVNWDQDAGFTKGLYKIEIYNKGYLSGATTFNLK